tara:strand:- start:587 stop:2734 length:2148 start_codon:yes stop_codon:yes gene_type:complete
MATKRVNIDIVAKDKSQQALNKVRGSLDRVKQSVFNVRNALAGLGAGLVIRNLVNTGKELENLQTRLKFLLKDTNEGAKAFDNMVKFASRVPFSLEEIQAGSGILATVTDNADDLQNMLEITGNVAAVTGLDFRTASEQIQRSFSAGIGAADLFREKGVRNMLGFKAGATVSIEETVEAFEKVFGSGGRFGQATDELANTFEGTLSMIGDKFFSFKKTILEAGFFPELKKQFKDLDTFLAENSKTLDEIAVSLGQGLAQAVKIGADTIIFLKDNFNLLIESIKLLISFKIASVFIGLAGGILKANSAMLLFNATIKRNLFIAGAAIVISQFDKILERLGKLPSDFDTASEAIAFNNEQLEHYKNQLGLAEAQLKLLINQYGEDTKIQEFADQIKEQRDIIEDTKNKIKELKAANDEIFKDAYPVYEDQIMKIAKALKAETEAVNENNNAKSDGNLDFLKDTIDALKKEIELEEKKNQEIKAILEKNKIESIKIFHEREAQKEKIYNESKVAEINAEIAHFQHMKKIHEEFAKSRIAGEKALEDQKSKIRKQAKDHTISESRDTLEILAGMNRTAFQAFKAVRIAEAIVDTHAAAVAAFRNFGGFPFGAIAAAATVAKGMAMVAQIKATSFREKGGPVSQGKPFIVGEKGPEMFVPNQSGNIIPNDKMGMGGVVNVNFTINAVDTRGFRALLTNERGTIVNLINQAVTDKGRPVLV